MISEKMKELLEKYRAIRKLTGGKKNSVIKEITIDMIEELDINNITFEDILLFEDIEIDLKSAVLLILKTKPTKNNKITENTADLSNQIDKFNNQTKSQKRVSKHK